MIGRHAILFWFLLRLTQVFKQTLGCMFISWFLWNFEKALQQLTGKCIYVPYWDAERDSTRETQSNVLHKDTFGTFGKVLRYKEWPRCTQDGIVNSETSLWGISSTLLGELGIAELGCLQRDFEIDIEFAGEAEVLAMIANYDQ